MENPLKQHFRQPELYVNLPSQGRFWPQGSLSLPATGELAVYSMTAADELRLLNPDAVFSGEAAVQLIHSCVPAVRDAWQMPSVDLEHLLVAIRIASTGETLDMAANCNHCDHEQELTLDLKQLFPSCDVTSWEKPLQLPELQVYFRPQTFAMQCAHEQQLFQLRKKFSQLDHISDLDQQESISTELINKLNQLELEQNIQLIERIDASNYSVTQPEFIREYVLNADRRQFQLIRDRTTELKKSGTIEPVNCSCDNCGEKLRVFVSLEFGSFFALSS